MRLLTQTISKALHPAYRVQNVERGNLERFKTELSRLLEHLGHSATESEEHLKNIVSDFLKAAFYREEHFVNTKDRQDLVIHNGRTAKDSVGVIIETKKPGNKSEMISPDKPNAKAHLMRTGPGQEDNPRWVWDLCETGLKWWVLAPCRPAILPPIRHHRFGGGGRCFGVRVVWVDKEEIAVVEGA